MKQLIFGHILPILLGSAIYLLFRTDSLIMFKWLSFFSLKLPLDNIRHLFFLHRNNIPDWIVFSLPDGLWIFSYVTLILIIWKNVISSSNLFWLINLPLLAVLSEIGQKINLVPGTFDFYDLLFYLLGAIFPILLYSKITLTIKSIKNEKNQ